MKKTTLLFIIILYTISGYTQNIRYSTIQSISPFYSKKIFVTTFSFQTPIILLKKDNKEYIHHDKDTIKIFDLGTEIIIRIPELKVFAKEEFLLDTDEYFVFEKNNTEGTFYQRISVKNHKFKKSIMSVDSFRNKFLSGKTNFKVDEEKYIKKISTYKDSIILNYTIKDTINTGNVDTIVLKFKKLEFTPFLNLAKNISSEYNQSLVYSAFKFRTKILPDKKKIVSPCAEITELTFSELSNEESKKIIELIHKLKSTY